MYLFKTSGSTFDSVIKNQKHAYNSKPKYWSIGEFILVSKNKIDCSHREKQIQYIMRLRDIRPMEKGESSKYWPGTEGRWKYLIICYDTRRLLQPFDLSDVLGNEAKFYNNVITFCKISKKHEQLINGYIFQ